MRRGCACSEMLASSWLDVNGILRSPVRQFMLTPQLRLVLAIASFVAGAYLLVTGDYAGVLFLGGAAYFGYSYFKYGTVWLAFREVARGHMNVAAELLQKVDEPQALGSEQRAYFELASGLVCASRAQTSKPRRTCKSRSGSCTRRSSTRCSEPGASPRR